MRYLITFCCYGSWLHGDDRGTVDRHHNVYGTPFAEPSPERLTVKRQQMIQTRYILDEPRRVIVLSAIREVCEHRDWKLWAAHVRTNHVHAIVEAETRPELIMNAFKSYASRALNRLPDETPDRKRWARHGSTRWIWKDDHVQETIRYVVFGQGEQMEVYLGDRL